MKKCIVSYADNTGHYQKGLNRLADSLRNVGFDGDLLLFTEPSQIGSPSHKEVPYAFKAHAIRTAIERDYDLILWCDSVIHATRSVNPVFDHIENHGCLFFDNIGHNLGQWTSDACLKEHNMTREKAFKTPMIMACVMGFNMNDPDCIKFTDRYIAAASDGVSYPGSWTNENKQVSENSKVKGHRHDQSVASIIIDDMWLMITIGQETYFAYEAHRGVVPISDSVCLWSGGL